MAKTRVWRRARTPEQQQERREEILQSAYRLFHNLDYEAVSLNAIARESGLTKPSIYLYFHTREDIFLTIYMDVLRDWSACARKTISNLDDHSNVREIATAWVAETWHHERLRVLAPLVSTSIERNVSEPRLAECVACKLAECERLQPLLKRWFPEWKVTDIFDLMILLLSLFGAFASYEDNKILQQTLNRPEFKGLRADYPAKTARILANAMIHLCPQTKEHIQQEHIQQVL